MPFVGALVGREVALKVLLVMELIDGETLAENLAHVSTLKSR